MVAALLPYRGLHWTALELLGVSWNLRTRLKLDYSGRLRPSLQTGGTIRLGSALLGMFFCLGSNTLAGMPFSAVLSLAVLLLVSY